MDHFDGHEFGIFSAIMVPIGLLLGVASSTIGFTAWPIIVPLLFSGFSFPVFTVFFCSMSVDFINGLALAVIYSRKGLVRFKSVFFLCLLAVCMSIPFVYVSAVLVPPHEALLRSVSGYVVIGVGLLFFFKGVMSYRKDKRTKTRKSAFTTDSSSSGGGSVDSDVDDESIPFVSNQSINLPSGARTSVSAGSSRWDRCLPVRQLAVAAVAVVTGAAAGLIGVGGGTNMAVSFHLLLGWPLLEATASGCLCMSLIVLPVMAGYVAGIERTVIDPQIGKFYPYLLVAVASGLLGTLLGSRFASRLSPTVLTFVVSATLIFMGILATVQGTVLKNHPIFG